MRELIRHEVLAAIYNLQLMLALIVIFLAVVLTLVFGALQQTEMMRLYENAQRNTIDALKVQAQYNVGNIYFNRCVPDLYFCSRGYNSFLPLTVLMPDQNTRLLPQFITSDVEKNIIFAVYESLDFTTVAGVLLSLAAMLFGHGAICGEKENGTLKMLLTGRLTRFQIAIAKYLGGLLPILIAYLLAVLCAGVIVDFILRNVVIGHLAGYLAVMGLGAAIMITYYSISFAVSTMVYSSKLSVLLCILIWLSSVFIAPALFAEMARTGSGEDNSLDLVRDISRLQKQIRYEWMQYAAELMNRYVYQEGLGTGQAAMRAYPEADEEYRRITQDRAQLVLDAYARRTDEKMRRMRLYSLCVPAIGFIDATNELCDAGYGYYRQFRKAVREYADRTIEFVIKRSKEDPVKRRLDVRQIEDASGKLRSEVHDENYGVELDLTGLPVFPAIGTDAGTKAEASLYAISADALWIVVSIIAIALRMRRYDVR